MMSNSISALQPLIRTVPICICTAQTPLRQAVALFEEQQTDVIVCVDSAHTPLGILSLQKTLPYLAPLVAQDSVRLQDLLEPLPTLPELSNWDAIATSPLELLQETYYAVLDHQQRFQGLIEGWQIVQALVNADSSPLLDLSLLTQLLESLPLPLMLQAETGEVIQQNQRWQQQLGNVVTAEMLQVYDHAPGVAIEFCLDGSGLHVAPTSDDSSSESTAQAITLASPSITPKTWQLLKFPVAELFKVNTPLWIILARDISEYRQLSQELVAKNADLIQLNRLKDEFLACITHELKTPLTAVLGLASLLKDAKLGPLNNRQTRYAQLIHQSGRHLMNVVNDILDLTRLETGQLHLSPGTVTLESICHKAYNEALQSLSSTIPEETDEPATSFSLTIEPGLRTIVADELRLQQMLRHLLANALKFTPQGGEIGLTVTRWQGWIDFTIWDTGIGIPESAQHLLFQKFQQLESPLTREFEGTGLGLVLTQRLARAHGGDVSFISHPGQGSQFTLLLPPHPPNTTPNSTDIPVAQLLNQLILVVEAVPHYIERLTTQLHHLGYRVVVARSGTEAIEKARQLQPRAILLNPLLPLLSGWDVLTLLKADSHTQSIPILITATQAEKHQARQYGAEGFLSLPITAAALQASLTQLQLSPHTRPHSITVLHLCPGHDTQRSNSTLLQALGLAMSQRTSQVSYRIVEAEDLDQADVLAKVWQPQVLLLDTHALTEPKPYLHRLSQHGLLAQLPLITLDPPTTQAAHHYAQLTVFPCLMSTGEQRLESLFQVIQVAAGVKTQPQILIMTLGLTSKSLDSAVATNVSLHHTPSNTEFLQALTQYLQTAGLRVCLSDDWSTIDQQIEQQNGDLLLLYRGDRPLSSDLLTPLQALKQSPQSPPLLLLEHGQPPSGQSAPYDERLKQLCDRVITYTNTQTMDELLQYIQDTVQ